MKSGPTYRRQGRWIVPVTPVDWQYWRSSTVPIIGVVYDPAEDVIRWCNLSRLARARVIAGDESFDPGLQSDHQTEVSVTAVLDDDSFSAFIDYAARYLDATADAAYLLLVDPEDAISGAEASGTAGRSVGTTPGRRSSCATCCPRWKGRSFSLPSTCLRTPRRIQTSSGPARTGSRRLSRRR
ncbi:hypothetical protein [Phytohabitans flavus]|uniref:hypothetical protein n=1 Tax=Phytohabitans flavus TaxID=1076124 RepID=UPI003CD069A4